MIPHRLNWIDWLKAVGIFAVIFGHIASRSAFTGWLYAFHMPLFFGVSGYLLHPDRLTRPFGAFGRREIGKLLPPYLLFGGIGLVQTVVLSFVGTATSSTTSEFLHSAGALLYGSDLLKNFPLSPGVLWFLPALLMGQFLLFAVFQIAHPWFRAFAVIVICGLGIASHNLPTPWSIGSAAVALPFLVVGQLARRARTNEPPFGLASTWVALALLVLGLVPAAFGQTFDLRSASVGNPLMTYPAAFAILAGLARLFRSFGSNPIIRVLSASSLTLFALHPFALWGIDTATRVAGLVINESGTADPTSVAKTVLVIALCLPAHPAIIWLLRRATPRPPPP